MNKPKHKYPHAHAHEQARLNAIKTLGLHEHNTAEDRARALGFDLNEKLYHGTNSEFPAFEKHPRYGAGTYATEDPEIADIYAMGERREGNAHPNVVPIVARGKKLTVSDLHPEDPHSGGWFRDNMAKATGMPKTRRMEEQLPKHGYDRLQINDMSDLGGVQTQHMFPDPSVIRSRFAAFDPHRVHENDLLAAKGGKVPSVAQMKIELKGRELPVTMHPIEQREGNQLVHVNPNTFDKAFQGTDWQYVGQGGKGGIEGRYNRFGDFVKNVPSIRASNATVNKNGSVVFGDGRHRYAYLRDQGLESIPMSMDKESIEHAKKHGYLHEANGGSVMGINVKSDTKAGRRYADMIVDGHKTLESRNGDSLRPYVGKRVAIVRTGEGPAKAIGEVTIGEPMVANKKKFRSLEDKHHVPEGSAFDINTPTKHLYPMHDPVRYKKERDVGHGIIARKVMHKAKGGIVSMLRKHGRPVDSDLDAMKKMSNGHRVFIAHEQDEKPREITSVSEMHGYTPDQIYTIDPKHFMQHKAIGGSMQPQSEPTLAQMRVTLANRSNPNLMDSIGVDEVLDMDPKMFINPDPKTPGIPSVGGVSTPKGLPIGGVDVNPQMAGQQLVNPPPQPPQAPQPPQGGAPSSPTGAPSGPTPPMGNMLQMTPQGQALNAMSAPQGPKMADGGSISDMVRQRMIAEGKINPNPARPKTDRRPFENSAQRNKRMPANSTYPESTEPMDKFKQQAMMRLALAQRNKVPHLADGGQPVKGEKYLTTKNPKRILFPAEGYGDVKGIVVPRHMWHGNDKVKGMKEINKARAEVYGPENRNPLTIGQIGRIHKNTLAEHFQKPMEQQLEDEKNALEKLRKAKHIGTKANTLDESEKLDTVRHEYDDRGRSHVGYASKGIAGHALYTSGHGENEKHQILNTCPGQTTGCGGGHDENGIVDTSKGTCFAPNAESQYVNASIRRASHEQAKHDPAMTKDWILAHTGSLRQASQQADKKNQRLLFRPNVVDETDVSSRHVLRHLNKQRQAIGKPPIIANSYGKTNELHDPENGYFVTHSNVGPKVKHGSSISENIARDKQRIRSTVGATDASGKDFVNDDGNKTPPKNSYMVTDVKRGSPMSKVMQRALKYAKYWSAGREDHEISDEEKQEGEDGHFDGKGRPTTEDKAHFGHITFNGKRYDYQKQHILHPRLVQVGVNKDGTAHMIPTDSRFKDNEFLPKNRFMTKNGKEAGAILMTTPTESTSRVGHHTSFTHHVNPRHIDYAIRNNGEYEVDPPLQQELALGKEYVPPQEIKIMKRPKKFAMGGSVNSDDDLGADDFLAFPEQNHHAQRILAKRIGVKDSHQVDPIHYYRKKAK